MPSVAHLTWGTDEDDEKRQRETRHGGTRNSEATFDGGKHLPPHVILKYLEGILRDDSLGKQVVEGSSSKTQNEEMTITAISMDSKGEGKAEEGPAMDRSKFKKVEMPVFTGTDPDSWLFRADRYFKIHNLSDSEKLTVAVISFDGPTLDWYRSQEEREAFKGWQDLKQKMLVRFRSIRDGTLVGRFLTIKQETTVEEYKNRFDKYLAPVAFYN
ncbi:transposon Tf2-1 polyprotein isoform X1 [Cucumis melo var. makuwa]|uniref:Transposon Tf2-1 polyprotein isoform X1 n=1 Tax=Cucumis melo var. makuwa TaxID=1194695 RepID=A0A5D3DWG6_CUCMM|nr:transposon Tf2-1 polyprotein isoform X1 [Cucumis melo var. makuwa]TYK27645.1 transposon Tf2-1 polyprotein isoform X1 [Cucumis melo var. makuwa]